MPGCKLLYTVYSGEHADADEREVQIGQAPGQVLAYESPHLVRLQCM